MKHVVRQRAKKARYQIKNRELQHEAAVKKFFHKIDMSQSMVGSYYPKDDEFDVFRVNAERMALPRTPKLCDGRVLTFHIWSLGDDLEQGQYNIPEPPETAKIVRPDILIIPLLAFDLRGYRIGYGGGYYDSTIMHLRENGDVLCVSLAYNEQKFDEIPIEEHDQRLDIVVTPERIYDFRTV